MAALSITQLIPQKFEGPPPPTGPKCEEPTPQEQYEILLASMNAGPNEVSSEDPPSSSSTFQEKVMNTVSQGMKKVGDTLGQTNIYAQSQMKELQVKLNSQFFQVCFPALAESGEKFISSFSCNTVHNDKILSGSLIVTKNYVCFCSSSASVLANSAKEKIRNTFESLSIPPSEVVGMTLPLASVVSILPSLALPTTTGTPHFTDLPEGVSGVLPSALRLYTGEGLVYQFFGFEGFEKKIESIVYSRVKGTAVELAYNYLDHAWRDVLSI